MVTYIAIAFLVTKICLLIIGPTKRDGKLIGIAKATRNFKCPDKIKKNLPQTHPGQSVFYKLILRDLLAKELQNKHFLLPTCITTGRMRLEARFSREKGNNRCFYLVC